MRLVLPTHDNDRTADDRNEDKTDREQIQSNRSSMIVKDFGELMDEEN